MYYAAILFNPNIGDIMSSERVTISIDAKTAKQISHIPIGSRSQVIRNLIKAYMDLEQAKGSTQALGAVLQGTIELTITKG
jgi:metal-responsive CopG/Arc/MetJ family transcriptional regulator